MTYEIGVQTFTYREFTIEEIVDEIEGLPVDAVEITGRHLDHGDDARAEEIVDFFDEEAIDVVGWSSPAPADPDEAEEIIAFAARHGIEYLNITLDPDDEETVDAAASAGEERGVLLGLHNHGPDATYRSYRDVLAVAGERPSAVGACLDTGHYLRVGETPADTIPPLGERVHAVHVKDFIDEETEVVPGDGNLDIPELVDHLE